ncbi:MAG: primase [Sphingomonas bacterium]|jgi:DNA primase|nr:DNA primase [Sphingomonas bacterium]MDB5690411.1 primase [Sphingomonas bacterium]
MSLSPGFLDELRMRTSLSALIGRSVKITRAGREWKACCPFHQEKTPSFTINDDKGFYHCFGCGAHGDAIRFLTEVKGLPFIDAVKELADAAGMDLPAPDPRARERDQRAAGLHEVMDEAAAWFEGELAGIVGAEARAYLQRRGIPPAVAKAFGIGFAPDGRNRLKSALEKHGIDRLVECGMLIRPEEAGREPYDRFRGRLMIPIRDARGRTIAFGGRILGSGEPKYLNSPETPLFDKGRTLFNLDRAASASRTAGRVVVVEGYMDVIALSQAGIDEAVAPLGTALTEGQLERLWRLVDVPLLCFDGDAAGQKAAIRAAQRALPMLAPGRSLCFATLPGGQDPDDLVRSGGRDAVEAVFKNSAPLVEILWRHEHDAAPLDTPEARAGLRRRLSDLAATVEDRDVREQYVAEFRRRFDTLFAAPAREQRQRWDQPRFAPSRSGRPGWKDRTPLPASAQARSMGNDGAMERLLARAVLAGLCRHPRAIAEYAEAIECIDIGDIRLNRLRDALLGCAFSGGVLEPDGLASILAAAGLADVADELQRTNILAFSFLRGNADTERAMRDLGAAIEALATRPELDAALAAATARLNATPDDAGFAEQLRLRAAREAADRSLAALVQGEDV